MDTCDEFMLDVKWLFEYVTFSYYVGMLGCCYLLWCLLHGCLIVCLVLLFVICCSRGVCMFVWWIFVVSVDCVACVLAFCRCCLIILSAIMIDGGFDVTSCWFSLVVCCIGLILLFGVWFVILVGYLVLLFVLLP